MSDELSGWGEGIHFPAYVTEDHLIGYMLTIGAVLAVGYVLFN